MTVNHSEQPTHMSDLAAAPGGSSAAATRRLPPWLRTIFRLASGAGLATAVAVLGLRLGKAMARGETSTFSLDVWEKNAVTGACLAAVLLVLLVHELGHLLAGRLVGFRAFLLIVGPMRLERQASGWSLQLNKSLGLAGGLAGSAPMDSKDLRRRTAIMVAGGPLASFCFAALAGLALLGFDAWPPNPHIPFGDALLVFPLVTFVITSTLIGAMTLVPMQTMGMLSDGARLIQLLRDGPLAERDAAIMAIIGHSLSGVRPRDWDPQLLQAACVLKDNSNFEFHALQCLQMHTADSGRTDESLVMLRALLPRFAKAPAMMRPALHLDAARQLALAGHLEEAREQYALANGPAVGAAYLKPAAEAAMLAAEGRTEEAAALVPSIHQHLKQSIDRGGSLWLMDSINGLRTQAGAAAAQ